MLIRRVKAVFYKGTATAQRYP